MECWATVGVCLRRCPAAHPGATRTGDSKFHFLYLFFHRFRLLQPQLGKRWCNYRGRVWFGQCGILLVLPLRNSSFTRYRCDDFKSPVADFGAPGRRTNYRPGNFMLFDDLEIFNFEMSFRAALRLLTRSRVMDSSVSQKEFFS